MNTASQNNRRLVKMQAGNWAIYEGDKVIGYLDSNKAAHAAGRPAGYSMKTGYTVWNTMQTASRWYQTKKAALESIGL